MRKFCKDFSFFVKRMISVLAGIKKSSLLFYSFFIFRGVFSQNAPVTTVATVRNATVGASIAIPVTVQNFNNVAFFMLSLRFDTTKIRFQSSVMNAMLPGMTTSYTRSTYNRSATLTFTWFSGSNVSLPDNTALTNLNFTYLSGTSALAWSFYGDDVCTYYTFSGGGYSLLYDTPLPSYYVSGAISNRVAPQTYAPVIPSPSPGAIALPLSVTGFNDIGAFTLYLEYNPLVLTYQGSFVKNASLPGNMVVGNQSVAGGMSRIVISYLGVAGAPGINLVNGSSIVILNFVYSNTNTSYTPLNWYEIGPTCEYTDGNSDVLIDWPTASFYMNGYVGTASYTASISYEGTPFCNNIATPQAVILSGLTGGSFTAPSGLSIDAVNGAITPLSSTQGTYIVTYTATPPGGGSNVVATTSVTILPLTTPAVSVSILPSANPFCQGSSVTITATAVSGGTNPSFQWYKNSLLTYSGSSSYTYSPLNNDQIKVIITSNAVCPTNNPATSNTLTMILSHPDSAVLSIVGSSCICNGNTAKLKVSITGGSSPYNVVYSNGTNSFTVNNYISGSDIVFSPIYTATYELLSVTDAVGCIVPSGGLSGNPVMIIDGSAPVITLSAPGSLGCNPTSAQINAAFGSASVSDNCSSGLIANGIIGNEIASGCSYSITKSWTATDACGNIGTNSQTLSFTRDLTYPSITVCPPPQSSYANALNQAVIPDFVAISSATDNCSSVTITQSPLSGTIVGLGTTTVTITATDGCGNSISCNTSFIVNKLSINGTVYEDINGLADNTVNGTVSNASGNLYMNLVNNSTNLVVASLAVNNDGTYNFSVSDGVLLNANYNLIITSSSQIPNTILISAFYPLAWISTGEHLGAGPGSDGNVDGILAVNTNSTSVVDANFGLVKVPDLTPVITAYPNVMHGVSDINIIVKVSELNSVNSNGLITVIIPKDFRWILNGPFDQGLTMLGSIPLNNNVWTYSSDAVYHFFTTSAIITEAGFLSFGFKAIFNPGNTKGVYTITSQINTGSGGEIQVDNNVDAEKLDYFIN